MGKIIGTKPDEVSISWVDYWSFGHLMFGAVAYFIIYAIVFYVIFAELPGWYDPTIFGIGIDQAHEAGLWGLVGATVAGIVWEPIENIGFVKTGWKSKRDSWPNLIIDCIMVFSGALVLYLSHIVWVNLVICIGLVVLLLVCMYLTNQNKSS